MKKLRLALRLTRIEIWRDKESFLHMLCLGCLAMMVFFTAEWIHDSLHRYVEQNAKELLGADIVISSRMELSEDKVQKILEKFPDDIRISRSQSFYTMASMNDHSTLVEIYAIDDNFPLYGNIKIKNTVKTVVETLGAFLTADGMVAYPELLTRFGANEQSQLLVGDKKFTVLGSVDAENTNWFGEATFAPRVYVHLKALKGTSLLGSGSISWQRILLATGQKRINTDLEQLSKDLEREGYHVATLSHPENRTLRLLTQMTDYLRVTSLIAIFIMLISIAYIYRDHLQRNIKNWAIMASLGAPYAALLGAAVLQLFLVFSFAGLLGLLFSFPFTQLFVQTISSNFHLNLPLVFSFFLALKTFFVVFIACFFINFPFLISLRVFKLNVLLGENLPLAFSKRSSLISAIFGGLGILVLALLYAGSTKVALIFTVGLAVSIFTIIFIAFVLIQFLAKMSGKMGLNIKLALLNLTRQKSLALWTFSISILAVFLMSLPEQLASHLRSELDLNQKDLPSLFLFDIQEEQLEGVQESLKEAGFPMQRFAPMIRARLITFNGEPISDNNSDRGEQRAQMSHQGYNLSYRSSLDSSEEVISGKLNLNRYLESSDALPEFSLEARFAERNGIKLADELIFDVQGIPIKGIVTSIRSVKWTSFQPNFFILLQPGVLDEAPKTYLATLPRLTGEQKNAIQMLLSQKFPNVSSIDISHLVEKLSMLIKALKVFFQVSFTLAALSGFFLVLAIVARRMQKFFLDFKLFKLLGYSDHNLVRICLWQNFLTVILSLCLGLGLSILVSRYLSMELFGGSGSLNPKAILRFSLTFILVFFACAHILLHIVMRLHLGGTKARGRWRRGQRSRWRLIE